MKKEKNWQVVDLEAQGFKSNNGAKPFIEGSGPFIDTEGNPGLSGNTLIRSWSSPTTIFLILFSAFWNIFVNFFIISTWNNPITINRVRYLSIQHAYQDDPVVIVFAFFPLIGIGLAYISLCLLINKTTISLKSGQLHVRSGPLPWGFKKSPISTSTIKQIYLQQYSSHSINKVPVISFRVMAQVMNQKDICIDDGFSDYSAARILEQWLESKLTIEDKSIPGEFVA